MAGSTQLVIVKFQSGRMGVMAIGTSNPLVEHLALNKGTIEVDSDVDKILLNETTINESENQESLPLIPEN